MHRFPYVFDASEMLMMRFWKHRVSEKELIKHTQRRLENQLSRQINATLASLSTLTRNLPFPPLSTLPPFDARVIDLTLESSSAYGDLSSQLKTVYAALHTIGKRHEMACRETETTTSSLASSSNRRHYVPQKAVFEQKTTACLEELRDCIEQQAPALKKVMTTVKLLKQLPIFDLTHPTLALVGAPNVGKSSLVHALTLAKPDIAHYPFTTRGLSIGHIEINHVKCQVADTPGLLNRLKRNRIEELTFAILQHTDAIVGFVLDPSETSGMSLEKQLALRHAVRATFPDKAWIDIVSKSDLESPVTVDLGTQVVSVSVETGQGLTTLNEVIKAYFAAQLT